MINILTEIPNNLIGISHDDEDLFPQYFELIKGSMKYDLHIKVQHNQPDLITYSEPLKASQDQNEIENYIVSYARMWESEGLTVIGFVRYKQHVSLGEYDLVHGPKFFVKKEGTWSAYNGESYLPVAFAGEIFLSPFDDRIMVYTEDEVGQKGEYLLTWQDGKFEIEKEGSPFIAYDFQKNPEEKFLLSSKLSEDQISKLNAHFENGTSLTSSLNLIFPLDYSYFIETSIFNDLPLKEIDIKPITKQSYPWGKVYVFSMDYALEASW